MTAPQTARPHPSSVRFAPLPQAGPSTPPRAAEGAEIVRDGVALLDETVARLGDGPVSPAMADLAIGLRRIHDALPTESWQAFADDVCLAHPVAALVHQDPFTYRAFAKPRGYPGDAGILDLIYGTVAAPSETTPLGAAILDHGRHSPASLSVRERRDVLVDAIDGAAARAHGAARVLSVACGHLREAQCSAAVRDGGVAEFHALDQDPVSLALLDAEHASLGVTPVLGSVKDLLTRHVTFHDLTLAYAAGLYDYLPTAVAARLTARLVETLAPGGRLLVANFCPETPDVGYMESFMAWRLIYRTESEMQEIAAEVPGDRIAWQRTFRDTGRNVVYLEIEKAG